MAVTRWITAQLAKQHGHVFPWAAVFYGAGVGAFFLLRFEPSPLKVACALVVIGVFAAFLCKWRELLRIPVLLLLIAVFGFGAACLQTQRASAPRLGFHYYGPIEGRVIEIDRSGSHALRLTLDRVVLDDVAVKKTPLRVRVSLHGRQEWLVATPGQVVGLTGHLSAPGGPVEPGGFNFQRHAWFLRIGGHGYTRTPALEMAPHGQALKVARLRHKISRHVANYLGGDVGGFAAAVTTGDRSWFSPQALEALRISNLAHLLAISGLHMGLLAGFLFAAFRFWLCLWQPFALHLPVKKLAALAALVGASGYLLLSGTSIATQRAYIMAAVALLAVFLDRRALTLRAVAIAALIVLAIRPSSLLSPGFQMSFAATTALVWIFAMARELPDWGLARWQKSLAALMLSSSVAGLATAPFAAAHFNQWAAYGLLANLSAVPAMGFVVIPGAVLAALLAPIGLEWIGLEIMGLGLRWILTVAHWVSDLEGARVPIVSPSPIVLPMIALGGCWLVLWQGRLRWGGAVVIALALWGWAQSERPDVLIAESGKLVGVMADDGRALSKERGQGFVAKSWLENDADPVDQKAAAMKAGGHFVGTVSGRPVTHVHGKRGNAAFEGCESDEIVVSDQPLEGDLPCLTFDKNRLAKSGAVAIWSTGDGRIRVETVKQKRGQRLWSPPAQFLKETDQ